MTDDKRQPGQVRLTGETRVRPDGNVESWLSSVRTSRR